MQKYNPPKNWPAPPPGWEPPPGWQPDPNWGPAPHDHQFWVDVPGSRPLTDQRGKAITITALISAGVALILCWVPIVNNLVAFLGLIAIVLAIISLVVTFRGRSTFRGMAIAALVVGILSVVGVLATQAYYQSILNGVSEALTGGNDSSREQSSDASGDQTPQANAAPSPGSSATAGSVAQPLRIGSPSNVGAEYRVTVSAVKANANTEVLAANQFNSPPKGQYVLVHVDVTYLGPDEGTPWIDLSPTFVGTDARQYDASDCGAVVDEGVMQVPTLEKGGKASYQVCMDVPKAAIERGKVFVEEAISFDKKTRVYWASR
jgi:hypothetical protein